MLDAFLWFVFGYLRLLLAAAVIGVKLGALTWLALKFIAWRDYPRAIARDARAEADRTWRRFE